MSFFSIVWLIEPQTFFPPNHRLATGYKYAIKIQHAAISLKPFFLQQAIEIFMQTRAKKSIFAHHRELAFGPCTIGIFNIYFLQCFLCLNINGTFATTIGTTRRFCFRTAASSEQLWAFLAFKVQAMAFHRSSCGDWIIYLWGPSHSILLTSPRSFAAFLRKILRRLSGNGKVLLELSTYCTLKILSGF